MVPGYVKGQRFYVRPNLDKVLRYLRHETEIIILGIDAVCINQSDEKGEKSAKLQRLLRWSHSSGLARRGTEDDDSISIAFGCGVPCILPPSYCDGSTEHYRFIGEA